MFAQAKHTQTPNYNYASVTFLAENPYNYCENVVNYSVSNDVLMTIFCGD